MQTELGEELGSNQSPICMQSSNWWSTLRDRVPGDGSKICRYTGRTGDNTAVLICIYRKHLYKLSNRGVIEIHLLYNSVLTVKIAHLFREGFLCPESWLTFWNTSTAFSGSDQEKKKYQPFSSNSLSNFSSGVTSPRVSQNAPLVKRPRRASVRPPGRLHLPALVPGAHGLPLDPPGALLVGAVADGALVSLHFPAGRDDSSFCKAVGTWDAEENILFCVCA